MDKANPNRRAMISGIAGASIAAVTEVKGGAQPHDPHPQWLTEWRRLQKERMAVDDTGNFDNAKCKTLRDRWRHLEILMCVTKATTLEGVTAQFEYMNEDLGDYLKGNASAPHENILDVIQASLKKLAGGQADG